MQYSTITPETIDTFLANLRKSTASLHAQLEENPASKNLLKPDSTINDYIHYLEKMYGVISFCETVIFPRIGFLLPDIEQRKKLALLEKDLSLLSGTKNRAYPDYKPFENSHTAFALGYMYVIEGSTLGGRVILKQLEGKLPVHATSGANFFAGYGYETGGKWKTFIQTFSKWTIENDSEQEVISGAKHAFKTIYQHFEQ